MKPRVRWALTVLAGVAIGGAISIDRITTVDARPPSHSARSAQTQKRVRAVPADTFLQQADAICAQAETDVDAAVGSTLKAAGGKPDSTALRNAQLDVYDGMVVQLRGLEAPAAIADDWKNFLDGISSYYASLRAGAAPSSLDDQRASLVTAATNLGLKACWSSYSGQSTNTTTKQP